VGSLRHSVPAIYFLRLIRPPAVGRHLRRKNLKGEKPADLPVQQSTKSNRSSLQDCQGLGITVPLPLSGRADEVIE
jgi:hypothetical protein